ncbi:hypothetical protein [Actinoplanes sp. NPDC026670]|uniref:hypothetical protein n=1 Tax=Actinoplanes sp. NPDC026670 TaxID=3154700 RepID=UPI0033C04A64
MRKVSDDTGGLRRVSDDTGGLRRVSDDTGGLRRVSDDTGGLRRVSDDTGGLRKVSDEPSTGGFRAGGDLPARKRGGTADDGDDLPRRGRSGWDSGTTSSSSSSSSLSSSSDDLPIVRTGGSDTPSWSSDSDPFSVGIGSLPADAASSAPWPDSFASSPSSSSAASSSAASPGGWGTGTGVSGGWDRRDEPVMWSDTLPGASTPTGQSSTLSNGPVSGPPGGMAPPGMRPPRRQSRLVTAGMAVLGIVALAAVVLTGVVYYSGEDNQIAQMLGGGDDSRVVSGPLEDRTIATFELLAATDRVQLRIADLGDDLYQISSPEGAGIKPSAEMRDDRLRVDVTRDDAAVGGEVEVVLAAKVRWTIRFSGYSAERIVDLSAGRVRGIEIVGGTRRAELTLADAAGTVPMKITGGMEELVLRAPSGSPVRIKVGGGAGTVTAGSRTLRDVAPGSTLTPKDWTTGNRYDVDAVAPVTLLTVETT